MPTVLNPRLKLVTENDDVHINIHFDVQFNEFERKLAGLGLDFHAHVTVLGVDPPGGTTGVELAAIKGTKYPVTSGSGPQALPSDHTITKKRADLQEDKFWGDADEIRGRIRIHALGFPPEFTSNSFTDQKVLLG
jgi:hypothetical protein